MQKCILLFTACYSVCRLTMSGSCVYWCRLFSSQLLIIKAFEGHYLYLPKDSTEDRRRGRRGWGEKQSFMNTLRCLLNCFLNRCLSRGQLRLLIWAGLLTQLLFAVLHKTNPLSSTKNKPKWGKTPFNHIENCVQYVCIYLSSYGVNCLKQKLDWSFLHLYVHFEFPNIWDHGDLSIYTYIYYRRRNV